MTDPYQILGLKRDASQADIAQAFRRLAKQYHPDLHPGDKEAETRFKEVSAAHEILSDPDKRARFDRGEIDATGAERAERSFYRHYAEGAEGAKYGGPFSDSEETGFAADDLFADLFGAAGRGGGTAFRMRGADVSYSLRIDFLDAVNGARRRLTLPDGETLDLAIPEGCRDRQTLRLKGKGRPGVGGAPAGDAYVELHVEPHAFFERKDSDIHVEVPVTLYEAVLGAKITVPTVRGKVSLTIPKGSNSGTTLRLKGQGVRSGGAVGDQYVTLKVVLPAKPDNELSSFLEGWAQSRPYDVRGKAGMG